MKSVRISIGVIVIALFLGLIQISVLSPADICWGEEETTLATIQQITQNIQAGGVKMLKETLDLAAKTVLEESLRYGVDYRLVLAVMKVESNYHQYGKSPDGARGFMQIQPSLAGEIAKEAGIRYSGLQDIYDPQKNIHLGIYYLSKLMDLYNDIPTVLFAYNVGHHKAKKLLAADKKPDTRYTKRVIAEYKKNTKQMLSL